MDLTNRLCLMPSPLVRSCLRPVLLIYSTQSTKTLGLLAADKSCAMDGVFEFHCRVLIPCYKEDLSVVRATCNAALMADLPRGTQRTVYLCDDGEAG